MSVLKSKRAPTTTTTMMLSPPRSSSSISSSTCILMGLACIISVILIIMASINYAISPAPTDLKDMINYPGSTFCIPVRLMNENLENMDTQIRTSINRGYELMISTLIMGIVLFCISGGYLFSIFLQ